MSQIELTKSEAYTSAREVSSLATPECETAFASGHESQGRHSAQDAEDMLRLGKKQLYPRNFNLISTVGFATILTGTWEYVLVSLQPSLINGGYAGMFAQYIWTGVGSYLVCLSLAEMSSMAPTAGGQYHWVSEFAPPRYQKFFSYIAGWTCVLAWQPGLPGGVYPAVSAMETLATYSYSDFAFKPWQASLLMIVLGLTTIPFNTVWRKSLPAFESVVLVLHFVGFAVTVILLLVLAPKNPASEVFGTVVNSGGWNSTGLSMLIGQVSTFYCLAGSDAPAHMSEEVRDASLTVPRAIVWSYLLNFSMGLIMLITIAFCAGNLGDAIDGGYPYVAAFANTQSQAASTVMTLLLLILMVAASTTCTTTESRQMWAFARDRGLPYSAWLSRLHPQWNVPVNCVMVTIFINTTLCLINLGSNFAFNIIISIASTGLLASYICSIGCLVSARLRGDKLPAARWSLGRYGLAVNILALLWSLQLFVFCFFPVKLPVTDTNMNWVVVLFFGVVLLSAGFYVVTGRKVYQGPVDYVAGKRLDESLQDVDTKREAHVSL